MAIRFDDIDGFNKLASAEWGEWGPELEVTQDMINAFAELTGDHQWIHVDDPVHAQALRAGRYRNVTPWARGSSPEKFTVVVARRM